MNKKQTKDYIRENIVNKYEEYQNLSKEDLDFMMDVLFTHEHAKEKIGCGVARMWLEKTEYGNKCFWLERADKTKTDFSFLKCFSKSSPKADFLKACRKAVEYIVIDFRDAIFGIDETIICPILNIPITKHQSHVDHDQPYPFIVIARMFTAVENIDLFNIKYINGIGVEFADKDLQRRWVDYHNQYAKLRVISAEANQKIKKEKWII